MRRWVGLLLMVVALGGCASEAAVPEPDSEEAYAGSLLSPEPANETQRERLGIHPKDALVATAITPRVKVYRNREADQPFVEFEHPGPFGTPRVFLVRRAYPDWVRVLVPARPNGTQGWIKAGQVELASNPYRIEVDLSDRRLSVHRRDRLVLDRTVAIGTASTPTPTGLFFSTVVAKPSDPNSPYGKFAIGLSGYSEVLTTFAGGEGQIAIHGTNQPSLIGTPVSHGCIRVDNRTITRLARMLPLGTPVSIRA